MSHGIRRRYACQMSDTVHLSRTAYERLKAEHDDLVTRGRIDIARKIEAARELGDLSENGDYHAAKEEQGKMQGRILHLASLIENATIVDDAEQTDEVSAGTTVSIRYEGDDEVEHYLLRREFIVRTPRGRKATHLAYRHLGLAEPEVRDRRLGRRIPVPGRDVLHADEL